MAFSPAVSASIVVSQCPSCAAVYAVPVERIGPAGARIRCPGCERVYDLERPAEPTAAADFARPGSAEPEAAQEPIDSIDLPVDDVLGVRSAEVVARITVEEIGEAQTREMVAADGEGALFARHGAALLEAFDRYRSRAGTTAPAVFFLDALRERLGIDVPSWAARP